MTLPATGAISFSAIQAEFGGAASPIVFSSYYRSGGLVPNTGPNASIATSGTINVNSFHGAQGSAPAPSLTTSGVYGTDGTTPGARGYDSSFPFGTMSPVLTSDGKTIVSCYQSNPSGTVFLVVSGFGVNPTQTGWATSITLTAIGNKTMASAAVYGYAAGTATWRWTAAANSIISGAAYTLTIP